MRIHRVLPFIQIGLFLTTILSVVLAATAQNTNISLAGPADTNAYRTLFRRVILYNNLAAKADAQRAPKPYLKNVLSDRFALSNTENESLQQLAAAYQKEIDPLQKQALAVRAKFKTRFINGLINEALDTIPPPELADLQRQEDAIAIRYRDLLRNSMSESEFIRVDLKVRESFGRSTK